MAEVLLILPAGKKTTDAGMSRERDAVPPKWTGSRNEQRRRDCTVVHVDFASKDLQLLRYKAKELEETRFVLYKQLFRTEIDTGPANESVTVRALVQKRMVQYYFYCPVCGIKVPGCLFPEIHGSRDYGVMKWGEIEELLRNEVKIRAQDHRHLCHGQRRQRG